MNYKKNIIVIDDHPVVAQAVVDNIESISIDFTVSSFTKSEDAYNYIRNSDVFIDLIILDVQLDQGDGFSFYRRIRSKGFSGKLIFFTTLEGESYIEAARRLGADGYYTKSMSLKLLKQAVIKAIYNKCKSFNFEEKSNIKVKLSQRETLVLSYLLDGLTNKKIAEKLHLSPKTISTYKHRLLQKHGASSLIDLVNIKSLNDR
ncbi:response regulator [Vibrio lentus]|uniref:DNA-binding response regulator n=1 Tax=Vibrio lentus TaxID=136468 RepID=A0A2N7KCM7_9VIBR|nr:response regulator transcription factor [Vibrio lentus]PMM73306.1 hypothetical protein BCT49_24895 [Vibrio lentus]